MRQLTLTAIDAIPEITADDDLGVVIGDAVRGAQLPIVDGDVVVVSQKIVSKAENRLVRLADVVPSQRAQLLALQADKDPAIVELILTESREVLRVRPGLIIVEHRLGLVLANAGIDQSNTGGTTSASVLLLPVDPDASAAALRACLAEQFGVSIGVVIIDSVGRAWRSGVVGIAIGCAGLAALVDLRGLPDRDARPLSVTEVAIGDQIAAAASLLMGEAADGYPVVVCRGLNGEPSAAGAGVLLRPAEKDLFR